LRFAPAFNASLDGDELVMKKFVNVGVAVDTPGGLVVPVIRNADQLGIIDIARELSSKAIAAQGGKLKAADFEGGCFTISSLGGVGGTGFTPTVGAELGSPGYRRRRRREVFGSTGHGARGLPAHFPLAGGPLIFHAITYGSFFL
jgi:pyruvate dehydrogenase E2 component (dihydrolipoamide acetyltransferase)